MRKRAAWLLSLALVVPTVPAWAQVTSVKDAWVRATVPRQKSSSAYMELSALRAARLLEVSSTVAGVVEIHEMRMENNVMKMRAIPALDLPAGMPVVLQPGGLHIMLMDLKVQLKEGDKVPLTFVVELRNGSRETLQVDAIARVPQATGAAGGASAHGRHGGH